LNKPDIKADLNKDFNFTKKKFDTIIASEIIEHMDNPLHFLIECKKLLKNKGVIILTTPNSLGLSEFQRALRGSAKRNYSQHLYSWNKDNIKALVERAGLKIKKFRYASFHWRKNIFLRIIAYLIPLLRPTMICIIGK